MYVSRQDSKRIGTNISDDSVLPWIIHKEKNLDLRYIYKELCFPVCVLHKNTYTKTLAYLYKAGVWKRGKSRIASLVPK